MDTQNSKLVAIPDRPRIFMSSKTSKVVVVFPNGEIVEAKLVRRVKPLSAMTSSPGSGGSRESENFVIDASDMQPV